MKVFYHAANDEIWIFKRNKIERGCQAKIKVPTQDFEVPDYLSLFRWDINMKRWNDHMKNGWLVLLGDL